jgi:hypothetical protein
MSLRRGDGVDDQAKTARSLRLGSDVPCELWCPKATYSQQLRVFTHEMGFDPESKRWILGETARRLYF